MREAIITLPAFSIHLLYETLTALACTSRTISTRINKLRSQRAFWLTITKLPSNLSPITYDWLSSEELATPEGDASMLRLSLLQSPENCKTIMIEKARTVRGDYWNHIDKIVTRVLPAILSEKIPLTSLDVLIATYKYGWNYHTANEDYGDFLAISPNVMALLKSKNTQVYLHFRTASLPASVVMRSLAECKNGALLPFYLGIDPELGLEYNQRLISKILRNVSLVDLGSMRDYVMSHLDTNSKIGLLFYHMNRATHNTEMANMLANLIINWEIHKNEFVDNIFVSPTFYPLLAEVIAILRTLQP